MSILSMFRLSVLPLVLAGLAFAQEPGSASVQAVVAFMNILDHEIVDATRARVGGVPDTVADDLLRQLEEQEILSHEIVATMRVALPEDTMDRGVFILYLRDLLNGTVARENASVDDAEDELESLYCGLVVPEGSIVAGRSERSLNNEAVGAVVRQFLEQFECIAPSLRDSYRLPVE